MSASGRERGGGRGGTEGQSKYRKIEEESGPSFFTFAMAMADLCQSRLVVCTS